MRLELRELRIPIVLTALILVVITYWAWQTWHRLDDREIGREQREAFRTSDILITTLSALDRSGKSSREDIEQRFKPILEASHYQFLLLERDGRRVFQAGTVPGGLASSLEERAFFLEDTFVLSRRVRLLTLANGLTSGTSSLGGEYLLVLGRDGRKGHMPPQKFIEHVLFPFLALLLLLGANAAAWVMVLRNRSLFEQLEIERTRSAHLEDLGLAAAGLAHETKNPLGIISGVAQQVARDPQVPEKSRALLETIVDEIDKSVSRLGLFMTFARQRKIEAMPLDAREFVEEIALILQPELDAAGVRLTMDIPALSIMADEEMFRQILVNLILNSLHASASGDEIAIRLRREGSHASVAVVDQGCGISKELLPKVFKPYVTGTPDGHGLGLSIVKRFAEDHGWSVAAESEPGQGSVLKISGIAIASSAGGGR